MHQQSTRPHILTALAALALIGVVVVIGAAALMGSGFMERTPQRLLGVGVAEAAYELGNGSLVLAQDTVPFALWVAATYLDDYRSAVRACIQAGGDMDTTAAIVGGIVAAYTGRTDAGIPAAWLRNREPLPYCPGRPIDRPGNHS